MRTIYKFAAAGASLLALVGATQAQAETKKAFGDPIAIGDGVTFDPMLDARLRWEDVDTATKDADAVTLRIRSGFEIKSAPTHVSFLVEGQATLALDKNYNAFPGTVTAASVGGSHQQRSTFATIADPENIALNRVQIQYKTKELALTIGRQRINIDDQRFVGSVGWRQNEQTFDAVRLEYAKGPVFFDGFYANRQNTIYGTDAGPRIGYDGDLVYLSGGIRTGTPKTAQLTVKGFGLMLDYGDPLMLANSSQTYGARGTFVLPLSKVAKLTVNGSYAHQSNWKTAPFTFKADYIAAEGALSGMGLTATAGYEKLGSDGAHAFQTPLATLHKFNGWADLFLTTPVNGLQDIYGGIGYARPKFHGFSAAAFYHQYDSDKLSLNYGHEWNAQAGIKTGKIGWLVKYADYKAKSFGVNTKKFWLEADYAF